VKFESVTSYKTAPNVATANARYYEGRYLAGVAAGRMTKTHLAGYVAGFPIPEVLQGINAFTLGMRSVDPKARDAAMSLFNQNVDVIAFHTGSTAIMAAAQERGRYYTQRARAVLDGTWKSSGNVWDGVKEGMIRVGDFGPKVPAAVRDEVLARQKDIAAGKLQPFHATADVRDNAGHIVIAKGASLTDPQILQMNWLVEGVQGRFTR